MIRYLKRHSPDSRPFKADIVPDWRSWQAQLAAAPCGRASGRGLSYEKCSKQRHNCVGGDTNLSNQVGFIGPSDASQGVADVERLCDIDRRFVHVSETRRVR